MGIIFSHPTGNANVRAAALGLNEAGLLSEFRTSIASFPGSLFDRMGAIKPFSEIKRRSFDSRLSHRTKQWPWIEMGRLLALKAGLKSLTQHEIGLFSVDRVYQTFDRQVANHLRKAKSRGADTVYAYEDGAEFSFKEAKDLQMKCLYDLPIGYWRTGRELMKQEKFQNPEWASTLTGFKDSDAKLSRKDEELRLADLIIVASQFTAKTLQDFPGTLAPIEIIPYGFPTVVKHAEYASFGNGRALKLLFVGGLSQRKGISHLFEAIDALGHHVELTVVGLKTTEDCAVLDAALAKHRWIPQLPHAEILNLMRQHDVLIFPSLFEGFGLVITEAMSQGTPVITTDRTAGPDLIRNGENGWLVEAGSTQSLQDSIENLLQRPNSIAVAGAEALETARKRPWERYGQELADVIINFKENL